VALIQAKGRLESAFAGRYFGSATTTANGSGLRANFTGLRNMIAGEGITDQKSAVPNGHLAPSAWFLPQVAGGMSSRGTAVITLTGAGNAAQGRNISGNAPITVIATGSAAAVAALAGAATITVSGSAQASAVFAMTGAASFAFTGSADPTAVANIAGSTTITVTGQADPLTLVWMIAEPIETALTADAIAAAVMASAVESGMTVTEALRLMSAALAGKVTVDGTAVTFRDVNDTTDRITATVTSEGDRTAVILDAS
jgi:hypothetical protein